MSYVMSLEGPPDVHLNDIQPRQILPASVQLQAAPTWMYAFGLSPMIWAGIVGVIAGVYLGGTKSGQALRAKFRRSRRFV